MLRSLLMIMCIGFIYLPSNLKAEIISDSPDNIFIPLMLANGYLQIQISEMAESKSPNLAIKNVAEQIGSVNYGINQKLEKVVADNPELTMPNDFKQAYQKQIDMFSNFSRKILDASFVTMEYIQLKSAVSSYQYEAENGINTDLKNFSIKNLPIIEDEYQKIQDLRESMPEIANVPLATIPDVPMALKMRSTQMKH
jgi:predicted outer membrane protein